MTEIKKKLFWKREDWIGWIITFIILYFIEYYGIAYNPNSVLYTNWQILLFLINTPGSFLMYLFIRLLERIEKGQRGKRYTDILRYIDSKPKETVITGESNDLDKLIKEGYVEQVKYDPEEKKHYCSLTSKGRKYLRSQT